MKVRELYTDESKWCQGWFAKTASGLYATSLEEGAASWCLLGAIRKCYLTTNADDSCQSTWEVEHKIAQKLNGEGIGHFNDRSTFAEVKALVDELDI